MRPEYLAFSALVLASTIATANAKPVEQTLYGCASGTTDTACASPSDDLLRDHAGNLYGVSSVGLGSAGEAGNVFKLTPVAGTSQYTIEILHAFTTGTADGSFPQHSVIMDANGNLFGTTATGGAHNHGTLFELSPPGPGGTAWTETILFTFGTATGYFPSGPLLLARDGSLYGAAASGGPSGGGTIFRLHPPQASGQRAFSVIYGFSPDPSTISDPVGQLLLGPDGTLYGAAAYGNGFNGGVFALVPASAPGGAVTEQTLHTFTGLPDGQEPAAGLTLDSQGNLYGTTEFGGLSGGGAVYELLPPASGSKTWTESVLYSFDTTSEPINPVCDLLIDPHGNLYGTTSSGQQFAADQYGGIFKLAPPAGQGAWVETHFDFSGANGAYPHGGLIPGGGGQLLGTVSSGAGAYGGVYGISQ